MMESQMNDYRGPLPELEGQDLAQYRRWELEREAEIKAEVEADMPS